MLLSDKHSKTKVLTLALCLGLGLGLSACQVRPLYSSTTPTGQTLAAELSTVEIEPAENRIEQEIRNNLVFAFTGGGLPSAPAYKLLLDTKTSSDDLAIESGSGLAKTTRVSMTATYKLIKLADKSVATEGSSFFTAEFARSTQRFANDRAKLDAQNRAAEQIANDIQLRLSAFFAAGT
nr:LPS assembly lipoprotein LptE [uncultured Cohaesibacter sp.]